MRMVLPRLLSKKNKIIFQKANLFETTDTLNNPARGWFQLFSFLAHETPDFERIKWCSTSNSTFALVIINIGAFQDEPLSEEALQNIREILRFFVKKEFDIILRVTYDHEGYALEREPFFFAQVKEHLAQISVIVKEFQEFIFIYQGMLIGNWGEMHTSKFVTPPRLKELWEVMRREMDADIFFAVRKPAFWRMLHPESCDKTPLIYDKMGLFDDAIFGSQTHLGTFGSNPRSSSGWEALWSRYSELEFENELCVHVPNGGEALSGEEFIQESSKAQILSTLQQMHITYLNKDYDRVILERWKAWSCGMAGVWQEKSLYEYIGAHLGYRFIVRNVNVHASEKEPQKFQIQIDIENVGFANFYQDAVVYLEWIDEKNQLFRKEIFTDMRGWNASAVTTICTDIDAQNCYVYLSALRKKDERIIYFANPSDRSGRVFLGQFLDTK